MARRIEHRSRFTRDAAAVHAALIDPAYLKARLAVLGGKDAELLDHRRASDQVEYHLKHGVEARDLPSAVRALLGGDLTIDRVETWRPAGSAGYDGTVRVAIPGMPGELTGRMTLADVAPEGSERVIDGSVRIPIPLVGGKAEETVSGQILRLLDAEHEFTQKWLAGHPA